jgi:N-methylhydantoinase B
MQIDPVTYQVIASRLSGIVQEMQDSIFRTGYSTIVRESQDASCMLLDADGEVVGEHVVLPLHVAALPEVVRAIRRTFGETIQPGDAFITNHPYDAGVTHSVDMAVVTPLFYGERLVAFCGSIAHKSDLGGMVPGTGSGNAREIFQEGIQYPPVRYMRAGHVVRDIEAIVRANSRTPELVVGDIRGQIGVARLGERRLTETIERYGLPSVLATFAAKQTTTETRLRRALASWPDGVAEAESFVDNDGIALDIPVRYHVRIEKRGDRISFDFTGSSDQTLGPINVRPALVRGCCYYATIAMIDPTIENNGGLARVVETRFRPGSVLDPRFPAPTNNYMATAIAVAEALISALGKLVPARAVAGVGGVGGGLAIAGRRANGTPFVQYESIGSAYGARTGKDGVSGISVLLSNGRTAPVEILESEFPTRVRRFALRPDSGGAGRYRGGLGPEREYEILVDGAQLTLRGGKHTIPAEGIAGGEPGALGACTLNPGTAGERSLPSRFSGVSLRAGDRLRIDKAGGGGFGAAAERPFAQIVGDVLDGYVSREAALTRYGADATQLDAALAAWEHGGPRALDEALAREPVLQSISP